MIVSTKGSLNEGDPSSRCGCLSTASLLVARSRFDWHQTCRHSYSGAEVRAISRLSERSEAPKRRRMFSTWFLARIGPTLAGHRGAHHHRGRRSFAKTPCGIEGVGP